MDYASLYPTTIMSYNISPETFLFSKTQLGEEEFEKQLKFLQKNDIKYIDTG
jgi:DNA polymerase elongation subunit (family B)